VAYRWPTVGQRSGVNCQRSRLLTAPYIDIILQGGRRTLHLIDRARWLYYAAYTQ